MYVPRLTRLTFLAVTLTVAAAGCARHKGSPNGSPAQPVAPAAPAPAAQTTAKAPPEAPGPELNKSELAAEFEIQQRKVDSAVRKLEQEHSVYATERSWPKKTFDKWWAWPMKKDREAIHELIREVADASERQYEIARELKNADLAVRAEVERDRAEKLLATLEDFNAHDHNKFQ